MKEFKFWAWIKLPDGNKEYREFTFLANRWTEARQQMSQELDRLKNS